MCTTKVITWLLRLWRSDHANTQDKKKAAQSVNQAVFRLIYNNDQIGTLEFRAGQWFFSYSDWFKNQSDIKPFANFPNVTREYVSDDLPPFFESRLPGVSQPQVEAFLKNKDLIDEGELKVALLKKFGRRSITSPFELQSAF